MLFPYDGGIGATITGAECTPYQNGKRYRPLSMTTTSEERPCSLVLVYHGGNEYQIFQASTDGRCLKTNEPPGPRMRMGITLTGAYAIVDGKTRRAWAEDKDMGDCLRSGLFPLLEEVSPITVPGHHGREARRQLERMGAYAVTPASIWFPEGVKCNAGQQLPVV